MSLSWLLSRLGIGRISSGGSWIANMVGGFAIDGVAVTATAAQLNSAAGEGTDIDAGASGTAGSVDIFPATPAKGKLSLVAADNTGNTTATITNAPQSATAIWEVPDTNGDADYVMTAAAQTIAGVKTFSDPPVASGASLMTNTVPRAALAEDALKGYPVPVAGWMSSADGIPLTVTAAADKFNLGAVGTGVLGIASKVAVEGVNTTESPSMATIVKMPAEYVAAGDASIAVTAKVTNVADVKTIDVTAYEIDKAAGTLSSVAASSPQNLTTSFATYTFPLTTAGLVAGDEIQVVLDGVVTDAAGGTTTGIQISRVELLCDIKG